ncbi:hypothetical protein GCM10027589_49800 [Actinocorallia lasiicapitis]
MLTELARICPADQADLLCRWRDWLADADAELAGAAPQAAAGFLARLPHLTGERLAITAAPVTAVERDLSILWTLTAIGRSVYWRRRFAAALSQHFHALREGAERAAEGRDLDLIQYIAWRREAGVHALVPLLAEHVLDAELPMGLTELRQLRTAARVVADVGELRADLDGRSVPCGAAAYPAVVAAALGGDHPAATGNLLHSRLELFDRISAAELPELFEQIGLEHPHRRTVERYLAGLRALLDGEPGTPAVPDDGTAARFPLPAFFMPFPTGESPHLAWLRPRIGAWTERMGFLDHEVSGAPVWSRTQFEATDYAAMVAVTHPTAPPAELELIAGLYVIGFYVDDLFAQGFNPDLDLAGARRYVARIAACMPAIALPLPPPELPVPGDPVQRALLDVWSRAAAVVSPEVLQDLFQTMKFMFDAFSWEVSNIKRGEMPDLIDYFETRRQAVGWWHSMAMHRCALQGGLPAWLLNSRPMLELICAAGDGVALRNDIISYHREVEREGELGNAVLIVNRLFAHDLPAAVRIVNELATRRTRHFEDCAARMPRILDELGVAPDVRASVDAFLWGLRIWMAGELAWELKSARHAQ